MVIKMIPKVKVVLATYNGRKFLECQLDSVMNQTYENIDIYIRDDGSKDDTVSFIQSYIKSNIKGNCPGYSSKNTSRKITLLENKGENLRCPESFYEILRQCGEADYYSFCDQDDEWYPQKIAWAVERLEKENKEEILLYYSACDYYTEKGEFIRHSHPQKDELELSDVLYYTPGSGFTIVINEKARQELILNVDLGRELHDRWLIRGAVCFGKVLYDRRSSATHIRHAEAVTSGDAGSANLLRHFIKKEIFGSEAVLQKRALLYFRVIFHKKLNNEQRAELNLFIKENFSIPTWFRKVFYKKRLRAGIAGEFALRILFLLGRI